MTYLEWLESNDHDAQQCRRRLEKGERGNPANPGLACELAFDAGKKAGIAEAAERIAKLVKSA